MVNFGSDLSAGRKEPITELWLYANGLDRWQRQDMAASASAAW